MEATAFKRVCKCAWPAVPGYLKRHLVVVDVLDKAIYIGRASKGEYQDFPCRLSIPNCSFQEDDLAVNIHSKADDQHVRIVFDSPVDFAAFMPKIRPLINHALKPPASTESNGPASNGDGATGFQRASGGRAEQLAPARSPAALPAPPPDPSGRDSSLTGAPVRVTASIITDANGNNTNTDSNIRGSAPSVEASLGFMSSAGQRAEAVRDASSPPRVSWTSSLEVPPPVLSASGAGTEHWRGEKERGGEGVSSALPMAETAEDDELLCSFLEEELGQESSGANDAVQLLKRKTAGEACISLMLPSISEDTKLINVAEEFQDVSNVLVCRTTTQKSDVVITKEGFMRRLLLTGVQNISFGKWERDSLKAIGMGQPPTLRKVRREAKLAEVLTSMVRQRQSEVAVEDQGGKIVGVLSKDTIFSMIAQDFVVECAIRERARSAGSLAMKRDMRYGMDQEDRTLAMPKLQRAAVEWLKSPLTKITIGVLLLADFAVEVYDSFAHFPCIDCLNKWTDSELGENQAQFSSYINCKDRAWLSDCGMVASMSNPLNMWAAISLMIFFLESLLRIFAYRSAIFHRKIDLFDTVVVWIVCSTFLALVIGNKGDKQQNTMLRWIMAVARGLRFVRFIAVTTNFRNLIGKDRSRYKEDGFDLDLSYITENCIAMSLPATGLEAKYRNPIEEVVRFFRVKHQPNKVPRYLIFNLCAERNYSPLHFDGNVEIFPTEDHNPFLLEQVCAFVERADKFFSDHSENVIAVHCKGGKGRTGLMVVCWLLYSGFSSDNMKHPEQDALEWFALRRTGDQAKHKQGVGQPGQRRYITYFHKTMINGGFRSPWLKLTKIIMHTCPKMDKDGGCDPWFVVEQNFREVFDYSKHNGVPKMQKRQESIEFLCNDVVIHGDIRITFFDHDEFPVPRDEKMCFVWFHTGFIEGNHLVFSKEEIDGASKDKRSKVFKNDFRIELFFEAVQHSRIPYRKLEKVSRAVQERTKEMSVKMRQAYVKTNHVRKRRRGLQDDALVSPSFGRQRLGSLKYTEEGFDLDLTYITDDLIAMAHPGPEDGDKKVQHYRQEVKRFFLLRHYNNYRIYNLCQGNENRLEELFPGCVRNLPCTHGHPPPLESLASFCADCIDWLSEDSERVAAVCCNTGRGRSGVLICGYLIQKGVFSSASHCVEFFNRMRGGGTFVFEYPSQVRYVEYVEALSRLLAIDVPRPVGDLSFEISIVRVRLYIFPEEDGDIFNPTTSSVYVEFTGPEEWRFEATDNDGGPRELPAHRTILQRITGEELDPQEQFIDFLPEHEGSATISGDVKVSVRVNDASKLSACFHTSMAGTQHGAKLDTEVFSRSQVERPPGADLGSIGRTKSVGGKSHSTRLEIHFSSEKPHPLAGFENMKQKMSMRDLKRITSSGVSASQVLDLSSSMNERLRVTKGFKK